MSAKKRKPKNDYTEALWAKLYRPMIEKKYELLKDDYIEISGVKLYRIRALFRWVYSRGRKPQPRGQRMDLW